MGRLTFAEIGKPLPNRRNILVSRNLKVEGAETVASLAEALELCGHDGFVIGGARLFAEALEVADRLELTEVHRDYEGDVSFPPFERNQWREVAREDRPEFDPPFSFVTLDRKPAIIA
jgi:dihydrofolate reductase